MLSDIVSDIMNINGSEVTNYLEQKEGTQNINSNLEII